MDQEKLDELFKNVTAAIRLAECGGDATEYVLIIKDWFRTNAPSYLK